MATHYLRSTQAETWQIAASDSKWVVTATGSIATPDIGIRDDGLHSRIVVNGSVKADYDGISSSQIDSGVDIALGKSGSLVGQRYGISLSGNDSVIVNHGRLHGGEASIYSAAGHGLEITNDGFLDGSVYSQAEQTILVNQESGRIIGSSQMAAIAYNIGAVGVDTPHATKTVNRGLIADEPGGVAFIGADGDDRLVNHGKMRGDIDLRSGNDRLDTRGGTLTGEITGGTGSDMLITDNAGYHMIESADGGYDTVRSTASYVLNANVEVLRLIGGKDISGTGNADGNEITGNKGDNLLRGKGGSDALDGGPGDDRLVGGGGDDRFVFATGYGHDVIASFDDDSNTLTGDRIDVGGWAGIDDFADIRKHLTVHGQDLVITVGHDSLTILGMAKADLDATDFMFGGI